MNLANDTLVQTHAAQVRFGEVQVLRDCTLALARGERLAIIGANGSGKSSLLRLLHGLLAPGSGSVERQPQLRQAFVFQRPWMLHATAQTNVALGLWLAGQPWAQARANAMDALAQVGLAEQRGQNAKTLSGGQQQRLALARAWACKPQILLLDEPTASLDPTAKRDVERLMNEFADSGMTLVFSSHNLGQVKRLASRVVYLEQGALLADLPTTDFFNGALPTAAAHFLKGELT